MQHDIGRSADATRDAIDTELAFAVVFEAVARGGFDARLDDRQRVALGRRFSADMVAFIEREVAFHAKRESSMRWSLGPPRGYSRTKSARSSSCRQPA